MNPGYWRRSSPWILALGGAAVVVVALAAAYFSWSGYFAARPKGAPVTLNIAHAPYFGLALAYIAHDRHLFEEENLRVNFLPYSTGKTSLQAVTAGAADLAGLGDLPVMFAANAGVPVTVIAMLSKADQDIGLVVRRDRGITRVREIRGKRIGVTFGTAGHFALSGLLLSRHLAMSDISVKNLPPGDLIAQLKGGALDGIVTWEPHLNNAQVALGENGAIFFAENLYNDPYMMAGLRAVIEEKQDAIRRLLRAMKKAESLYSADPQASYPSIANHIGMPLELVQRLMPRYHIALELGQSLIMSLEDETRWAMKNRLIPGHKVPNFMNHVALEPMLAVKPNAVTIIH